MSTRLTTGSRWVGTYLEPLCYRVTSMRSWNSTRRRGRAGTVGRSGVCGVEHGTGPVVIESAEACLVAVAPKRAGRVGVQSALHGPRWACGGLGRERVRVMCSCEARTEGSGRRRPSGWNSWPIRARIDPRCCSRATRDARRWCTAHVQRSRATCRNNQRRPLIHGGGVRADHGTTSPQSVALRGAGRRLAHVTVALVLAKPATNDHVGGRREVCRPTPPDQRRRAEVARERWGRWCRGFACFEIAGLSPWVVFRLVAVRGTGRGVIGGSWVGVAARR